MTTRVLTSLFQPATAVVGRLKYAQKFVVVGLVLLVPLGFVATAYVQLQRAQIAFSAKERDGVAMMAPLIRLTATAAQARHESVGNPHDGAASRDLTTAIAAVDAADRRLGKRLAVRAEWQKARALVLAARAGTGSPAERFDAYNAATRELIALIVRVGDESNLTLDPDLDTYYLMDTLQFRLPVLLDTAGHSVDRTSVTGPDMTDAYIDLGLDNGVLTSTREVITRAVRTFAATTADAAARRRTLAGFQTLDQATAALGEVLTTAVKGRQLDGVPVDAADAVRAAAARFATEVAGSLDTLLAVRIDGYADRAFRVEVATALAALLGGYLFGGFYLSVAPPVRRIVGTLHAVAGGDLTRRVSVDTHDELSFIARALNETVAQTEIATNRLALRATHDPLTSLPNRALVMDRLGVALARTARTKKTLMAVLFIDLDRFKPINDTLGHETGDEVLCAVAGRLRTLVRDGDLVARLAGDEFVVIVDDLSETHEAVRVAERIVTELSAPIRLDTAMNREVNVGASVGIAFAGGTFDATHVTPDELVRDADVAMYRAKQRGRGRVVIFDEALREAVERRVEIQDDLRHGIENGQLRVVYEPVVDGHTGAVLSFEALARWQHPVRGLLGPSEFIDVAEESGLIVPLGAAVLREACAQTARWRAERPGCADLHIAVNVSGAQFAHASFVPTVASVLAETGLEPSALWLEITETIIMSDVESAGETLRAIRALGVRLAIDDFGTGYSSLAYLRRFPVEALKIDKSFIAGLGRDREDEAIVEMILSLARTLDLHVVAEGVETAEQLRRLDQLGCALVQGFHLGRPAPAEDVWVTSAALLTA